MTPQQLKNSILQMAMQGKLVEQRPEEGTGEELYQQIQKEKQKLIKEGKIKKQKPLPEITEEEVPFEIPENWKWVRLGDISSYAQPKAKIRPSEIEPDTWSLDLEDIEKNSGKVITYTKAANRKIIGDKVCFKKGNILYSKLRPYLMKMLIAENDGITTPEIIPFDVYGCSDQRFYLWLLRSPYVDMIVNSVSYGVKMPRVGTGTMVNLLVPLPPLAEQKRIVAKIEEIMPYIDRYAVAYDHLQSYNTRFPDDLKKSILQMAIQGKLVPQDPNDEPASVLLEKIAKEKQKLVKEGKIKKQKPLPEITEDEIPFEIPESWEWVRLENIVTLLGDGIHGTPKYNINGEYYFINGNNLHEGKIIIKQDTKTIGIGEYTKYRFDLNENTVLISINGTVGNLALYRGEPVVLGKSACYFDLVFGGLKYYIYWTLKTDYFRKYAQTSATGTTINNVSLRAMRNFPIPLPPLAEQKRIVAKLDELLPQIDGMK